MRRASPLGAELDFEMSYPLEWDVPVYIPMEVRSTGSGDTSSPDDNEHNVNSTMNADLTDDTYHSTATRVATLNLDTPR